ncbi:MAG: hypothetical protein C4547_05320 [Phycisphaerales bacterium]|nr:MAG: hypothetical protein C4547_05320 [Phycisphaerales bacterium]
MGLRTVGAAALAALVGTAQGQIVFEQDFVQGQPSPNQCTEWRAFQALLVPQDYTLLVMKGTNDPDGIECTDPDAIAAIAAALNTNGAVAVDCDGRNWRVGACGGGSELSAMGSICSCPNPGYIVRPCIGNANWGGVNTATCGGTTQTMIVEFHAGPPEPTACCLEDASCEMLLPDECEGKEGIVHRNKTCDDVQCDWACCLPDGSCESLSSQRCDAEGGIWNENSACEDVECTGACCLPDDTCEILSEQQCGDAGGRYNKGLACEDVNCEIPSVLMSTNQSTINNPRAQSFGYDVTARSITDIVASQDLAGFDFVWINPNVSAGDAAQLRAGSAEGGSLDLYAKGGGVLVINIAGNAGDQADIAPGGTDYIRRITHQAEQFTTPDHPYLTGEGYNGAALTVEEFNNWNSTDHGWLEGLPDAVTVLSNPDGPSWAQYDWGSGTVIVTTLTYGWGGGGGRLNPLDNHLKHSAFVAATQADNCTYKLKKSKAKGGCENCPSVGDDFRTEAECEIVKDCDKKVKTVIACPGGGPGTCKLKGKRSSCG